MSGGQVRQAHNHLKSYSKRMQDGLNAMLENFSEIVKAAKLEENAQVSKVTQSFYDTYQMQVRAANIVRAGESLLKLVSELKTFVILNDFPSINQHVKDENDSLSETTKALERHFLKLKEEFSIVLYELESEKYAFS